MMWQATGFISLAMLCMPRRPRLEGDAAAARGDVEDDWSRETWHVGVSQSSCCLVDCAVKARCDWESRMPDLVTFSVSGRGRPAVAGGQMDYFGASCREVREDLSARGCGAAFVCPVRCESSDRTLGTVQSVASLSPPDV